MNRAQAVGMVLSLALAACSPAASEQAEPGLAPDASPLYLTGAIALDNVKGRIDHLALDEKRQRLFVAALGNGTVEVLDLAHRARLSTIDGVPEAQGVLYLPDVDRVVATSGERGEVQVFDGDTLASELSIKVGPDADNLRYDAARSRVFVAWGNGVISGIDAKSWKIVSAFSLNGHPEAFQLHSDDRRLFVNVPAQGAVEVIQRAEKKLEASFSIAPTRNNFPLCLLEADHKIAVGCRSPAQLVILDDSTGKVSQSEELSADVDDLFFDPEHARIFAICGDGWVDVIEKKSDGLYRRTARTKTSPGARTGLYVSQAHALYVAAPARSGQSARILIYEVRR